MVENRCLPARTVKRIKIVRDCLAHFPQCGKITANYRRPYRKSLRYRHSVAFRERGHDERPRALHKCGKPRIGAAPQFVDMPDKTGTAFQHVHDLFVFPASSTDHDQARHLLCGQGLGAEQGDMDRRFCRQPGSKRTPLATD